MLQNHIRTPLWAEEDKMGTIITLDTEVCLGHNTCTLRVLQGGCKGTCPSSLAYSGICLGPSINSGMCPGLSLCAGGAWTPWGGVGDHQVSLSCRAQLCLCRCDSRDPREHRGWGRQNLLLLHRGICGIRVCLQVDDPPGSEGVQGEAVSPFLFVSICEDRM